jgi:hypothetical protein
MRAALVSRESVETRFIYELARVSSGFIGDDANHFRDILSNLWAQLHGQ